jgi:hypothetical protein
LANRARLDKTVPLRFHSRPIEVLL